MSYKFFCDDCGIELDRGTRWHRVGYLTMGVGHNSSEETLSLQRDFCEPCAATRKVRREDNEPAVP